MRQGLYKLQLIHEAKKTCPDVVIVLGEDLTRFRNASKDLYTFLRAFSWNSRVERLGFDEVCLPQSRAFLALTLPPVVSPQHAWRRIRSTTSRNGLVSNAYTVSIW